MKDYEVGYGRPPKASQFKPGQSGNRAGRRSKKVASADSQTIREISAREARRIVKLHENGQPIELTVFEAIIRGVSLKAMKGDPRAAKFIMDYFEKHLTAEELEQAAKLHSVADFDHMDQHAAARAYLELVTAPMPPTR